MKTLSQLINYVSDFKNDLQGFKRQFVIDNLRTIERQRKEQLSLLEMVLDDLEEDGNVSQKTINSIKDNLNK